MTPVLVKKPKTAQVEEEYVMTPEEEEAYRESFEDQKHGRLVTDAELRKMIGAELDQDLADIRAGKTIRVR